MASAADESLFGPIHEDVQYTIKVGGLDDSLLRVASFSGTEEVSELFSYRIAVASAPEVVAKIEASRGRDATFAIKRDDVVVHSVRGVITAVSAAGPRGARTQAITYLQLEPALARLRYGRDFRIFQDMSASDIVTKVLKDEQIECVWRMHPLPAKRDYCTQFGESDLEFVQRLASEEGASFFFDNDGEKMVVVFAGDHRGFKEVSPNFSLPFNDVAGAVAKDHVRSLERTHQVTIGAFEHRAYNFKAPGIALKARKEANEEGALAKREHRDFPGTFMDHHGGGDPYAEVRLQELRARALTLQGTASCLRLSAGRSFTLTGHRDGAFNRKLLVTRIALEGTVPGAVGEMGVGTRIALSAFEAVPADTPIHPPRLPRPTPRLQSAKVVGPSAGSPHVDKFGRIKVQFFWDRQGKNDEHSSCWIRQMTLAAYADEGFWTAHKVGSEVVVDFLDGDIDQPLVLGAVFNGSMKQPNKQPDQVSRSTWKVRGIPGGTGYNEITLECKAGAEQIILHAQKDLNETVLNNHTEMVKANQTSRIGANQSLSVHADRSATVGRSETISVGSNQTSEIGANRSASVGGDEKLAVVGSATKEVLVADTVLVGGVRSLTAGSEVVTVGTRAKTVLMGETINVGGGRSATVGGDESVTVAGNQSVAVAGARNVSVTGADSLETDSTIAMTAKEAFQAQAGDDAMISMNKDGEILFKAGDASILLKKSGDIEIKGTNLILEADSNVTVKGSKVKVTGDEVEAN